MQAEIYSLTEINFFDCNEDVVQKEENVYEVFTDFGVFEVSHSLNEDTDEYEYRVDRIDFERLEATENEMENLIEYLRKEEVYA